MIWCGARRTEAKLGDALKTMFYSVLFALFATMFTVNAVAGELPLSSNDHEKYPQSSTGPFEIKILSPSQGQVLGGVALFSFEVNPFHHADFQLDCCNDAWKPEASSTSYKFKIDTRKIPNGKHLAQINITEIECVGNNSHGECFPKVIFQKTIDFEVQNT